MSEAKHNELNDSTGTLYWIVTMDSDPMPYEYGWEFPFQIVQGTEAFVKAYCDSLNAEDGPALYGYSKPSNQEILYENDKD